MAFRVTTQRARGGGLGNQRGISIIGTVFTLILLGLMGAALVAIVADEQESRMRSLARDRAFYAVQAGFEYALREIKEGGYPIVTAKSIGTATFTNAIDPIARRITTIGSSYEAVRTHSITTAQLASDCATINSSGAHVGGLGANELLGITVTRSCLNAVNIATMTLSWSPQVGEHVRRVQVSGTDVYNDLAGTASGEVTDITDARIPGASAAIDLIEFSSSISGKTVSLTLTFTDSSSLTKTGIAL